MKAQLSASSRTITDLASQRGDAALRLATGDSTARKELDDLNAQIRTAEENKAALLDALRSLDALESEAAERHAAEVRSQRVGELQAHADALMSHNTKIDRLVKELGRSVERREEVLRQMQAYTDLLGANRIDTDHSLNSAVAVGSQVLCDRLDLRPVSRVPLCEASRSLLDTINRLALEASKEK